MFRIIFMSHHFYFVDTVASWISRWIRTFCFVFHYLCFVWCQLFCLPLTLFPVVTEGAWMLFTCEAIGSCTWCWSLVSWQSESVQSWQGAVHTPASDVRGRVCGTGAVPPCVGVSLHLRRLWVQGTLCFCLFVCLLPFSSGIGRNTCASRTILYDNPPEMFAVQQFLQVSSLWKSYMFGVKNFLLFFQTRWECVDDLLPYHH